MVYKFIFEVALKNNSINRISADANLKKKESGGAMGLVQLLNTRSNRLLPASKMFWTCVMFSKCQGSKSAIKALAGPCVRLWYSPEHFNQCLEKLAARLREAVPKLISERGRVGLIVVDNLQHSQRPKVGTVQTGFNTKVK